MFKLVTLLVCIRGFDCTSLVWCNEPTFKQEVECLDKAFDRVLDWERKTGLKRARVQIKCLKIGGKPWPKHW